MKSLIIFAALILSTNAYADSAPVITCTGENVILTTKTPYLGENRPETQTLYVLKSIDNADEAAYTAYFLDVDVEGDVDKYGMVYTAGKNSKGGKFVLKTKFWEDVGDGTIINEKTSGTLTYKHGPLKGKVEPVDCVKN